jgi:hypothetical protein
MKNSTWISELKFVGVCIAISGIFSHERNSSITFAPTTNSRYVRKVEEGKELEEFRKASQQKKRQMHKKIKKGRGRAS